MSEMALTAEHLIVIGRGRLLADTTYPGVHQPELVGQRPHPHPARGGTARRAVSRPPGQVTQVDGFIEVDGVTTDDGR